MNNKPHYLDELVRRNTAFTGFYDLVNSHPGYRPSLDISQRPMVRIADGYDAHMKKIGDPRRAYRYGVPELRPGMTGRIWVNQARRNCRVLAVADGRALIEYDMPGGLSYYWDVPQLIPLSDDTICFDGIRNIQPKRAPKRWREALAGRM